MSALTGHDSEACIFHDMHAFKIGKVYPSLALGLRVAREEMPFILAPARGLLGIMACYACMNCLTAR